MYNLKHPLTPSESEFIALGFAEMHVQAALQQASEEAETDYELNNPYDPNSQYAIVKKESILNAYSLDNIK